MTHPRTTAIVSKRGEIRDDAMYRLCCELEDDRSKLITALGDVIMWAPRNHNGALDTAIAKAEKLINDLDDLHKEDLSKPVALISRCSSELMTDRELLVLMRNRGVDTSRKTRIDSSGYVYYVE